MTFHNLLVVAALLLLFAAIFNPPVRANLTAAGLFCWLASTLV